MSMNIWALKGHLVKVTEETKNNGYDSNVDQIERLCEINKIYTVDYTVVHGSFTEVFLKEYPDESFNSVNFEDAGHQPEALNVLHDDWDSYNEDDGSITPEEVLSEFKSWISTTIQNTKYIESTTESKEDKHLLRLKRKVLESVKNKLKELGGWEV